MMIRVLYALRRALRSPRNKTSVPFADPVSIIASCLEPPIKVGEHIRFLDKDGREAVLAFTGFKGERPGRFTIEFRTVNNEPRFNTMAVVGWYRAGEAKKTTTEKRNP